MCFRYGEWPMAYAGFQIPAFTFPDTPPAQQFDRVVELASAAEQAEFDSVWVMDHFIQIPMVGAPTDPILEAYTTLAALASRTSRVDLGALVTGVTYRNPALLAKMVTSLDVISGGRAVLGIGAAWYDVEHAAYGYEFPPLSERYELLEDALEICTAMFSEEAASHSGRHTSVTDAYNVPRPVRAGGPPILVGGSGERKTLRLVARYADYCNIFGDVDQVRHLMEVLDAHCADVGRDPSEITRTRLGTLLVAPTVEEAEAAAGRMRSAAGIDVETFDSLVTSGSPDTIAEQFRKYLDAGLDGHIVNLAPGTAQPDTVALAGEAMRLLR